MVLDCLGGFIGKRLSIKMLRKPTLIVGGGRGGSLLIRQMRNTPYMGMEPVLVVDDDPNKQKMSIATGVKVQGYITDIPDLVKKFNIKNNYCNSDTFTK